MNRYFIAVLCATVALSILLLTRDRVSGAEERKAITGPTQVMETKELMKIMMDPLWEDLRDEVAEEPTTRRDWRFMYITVFSLAETQNLLFSREGADYSGTDEWNSLSGEALAATIDLCESVRDKDFELILKNKDRVMNSCNKCHERFEAEEAPKIEP